MFWAKRMSFSVIEDCLFVQKKAWYLILDEHEMITAQENYKTKQTYGFHFA